MDEEMSVISAEEQAAFQDVAESESLADEPEIEAEDDSEESVEDSDDESITVEADDEEEIPEVRPGDDLDSPRIPRRRLKEVEEQRDTYRRELEEVRTKAELFDHLQGNPALAAAYVERLQQAQPPPEADPIDDLLGQMEKTGYASPVEEATAAALRLVNQQNKQMRRELQSVQRQSEMATQAETLSRVQSTFEQLEAQNGIQLSDSEKGQVLLDASGLEAAAIRATGRQPNIESVITKAFKSVLADYLVQERSAGRYAQSVKSAKRGVAGSRPSAINSTPDKGAGYAKMDEGAFLSRVFDEYHAK